MLLQNLWHADGDPAFRNIREVSTVVILRKTYTTHIVVYWAQVFQGSYDLKLTIKNYSR